ncbi:MAG TPA: TIR domain-containing protein [Ktedonobacteraceae bacterium]
MKQKNMTMNTIACPNCQKESLEGARFCSGCGQALPAQTAPAEQKAGATEIFLLYAHEDEDLKEQFLKHMAILRRSQQAMIWHDGDIQGGEEIHKEVDAHMTSAKIILMLISASFIASDYCYGEQMEVAMRRHKEGTAKVVPIIIKPVDWKGTPFDILQAVPHSGKPISTWNNRDEAWLEVVRAIKAILK